jgi:hypothetical protein
MISLQTSYRLDDRNYAGGTKDGNKQEVALHPQTESHERPFRCLFSSLKSIIL